MAKIYFFERVNKMTVPVTTDMTVKTIAKAFLNMEPMSPKKLQKMCYYAYVWYLTLRNDRLFENNFQAWIHGPVDPTLYTEYKEHGWKDIPQEDTLPLEIQERPEIFEFLEEVFASYGHLNGDELEYLTHNQAPWLEAREGLDPYESSRNPINDETIIRYHLTELKNGNS
ncbi:Panacea domain-containing protein [Sutcliffiella horikoshii]|uniref:Panacea domain-containing protein n=1 Tax=Sutcliffiella horikoshii TaxID=79883 RepID=UPI00384F74C2